MRKKKARAVMTNGPWDDSREGRLCVDDWLG